MVGEPGDSVDLRPVLVVDGDKVISGPADLAKANVTAKVVEEVKSRKIEGFTYKSKSNQRRRYGHRQRLSRVEITKIKS